MSVLHTDVAAYAIGSLDPDDRTAFEGHLERCELCRSELAELRPAATLLRESPPLPAVPAGLEARTLLAVQRVDRTQMPVRPRPRRSRLAALLAPRPLAAGLAAAAIAVAVGLAIQSDEPPVEVVASLRGTQGQDAAVAVTKTGIGRVIRLDTRDLPILLAGEYYELWWVGPGDRPGRPNRISAGTFHPDEDGRSLVVFAAAVDPQKYPRLAVTAEPGDGDPAPHGRDVLTGRVESPR